MFIAIPGEISGTLLEEKFPKKLLQKCQGIIPGRFSVGFYEFHPWKNSKGYSRRNMKLLEELVRELQKELLDKFSKEFPGGITSRTLYVKFIENCLEESYGNIPG